MDWKTIPLSGTFIHFGCSSKAYGKMTDLARIFGNEVFERDIEIAASFQNRIFNAASW